MTGPIRIGSYALRFPQQTETFVVSKFVGLIDAGLDVEFFALGQSWHWDRFLVFDERPDLQARVHHAPERELTWRGKRREAAHMARTARAHPAAFARYLLHNWNYRKLNTLGFWKGTYLRLPFVGTSMDVLHVEFDTMAVEVADLKRYLGCSLVLSNRSIHEHTTLLDRAPHAHEYLFGLVDAYHFESEFLRDTMIAHGLPPTVPTWVINSAVDLTLFRPGDPERDGAPSRPLRVISVGRLSPEKGLEFGLEAVALVRKAGTPVELTIVGAGSYEEAVRFAAVQLGVQDVVRFTGNLPPEQVAEEYRRADLMLHASVNEGMCHAVVEAQASGLPVVTTDAGGLRENVQDGVTGFVTPRRSPGALAEKLLLLAGDPSLRRQMGDAGRQRALDRFDHRALIESFSEMYRQVASARTADSHSREHRPGVLPARLVAPGKVWLRAAAGRATPRLRPDSRTYRVLRRVYRRSAETPPVIFGGPEVTAVLDSFVDATPDAFFVQIGSNDGRSGDPIHPYITGNRWHGLLVEPVPYLFERLLETYAGHPGLAFDNVAIAPDEEFRPIYRLQLLDRDLPFWYEQLASFDYDLFLKNARNIPGLEDEDVANLAVTEQVRCSPLDTVFSTHGVERIDLLHIDTEGYDFEILKLLDFRRWRPRMILYEHRHLGDQRKASFQFLMAHGYRLFTWKNDAAAIDGAVRSVDPLRVDWRRRRG